MRIDQRDRPLRRSVFLALALCSVLGALPALGFCPNNGLKCGFGGVGVTHKDMTKQAIKELDAEFFSTSHLTKSMKNAIKEIWKADAEVDKDQVTAAKHFDGESFAEGQARILGLLDGIVGLLQAGDGPGARSQLGQALHTIQDFYSHSTWIESGNGGPNPSLGRPGQAISPVAGPLDPTCTSCTPCIGCGSNVSATDLTSGYYGGEDHTPPSGSKCRHGGPFDSGTGPSGGINKDTRGCLFSPHFSLHDAAASTALEATKQFVRDIRDRVTPRQLKLLLGVGPTLAMAIDTTGSMGSIISQVQAQAVQIVDARIGTDQEPLQYVLSPFNDPSTGPLTVTSDPAVFKAAINSLFASGGGDCPELAMTGALQALSAADEGIDLFTFTDADAKDAGLADAVSSLAISKDAKIYPLLFGSCGGFLAATATALPVDPAFQRIANDSGGQLFLLNRSEAGQITRLADAIVRANAVDVLSVADTLTAPKSYSVPVDSTLSSVTFSVSGTAAVTVTRPNGAIVLPTDADVRFLGLANGAVYTLASPAPGLWQVAAGGSGPFSLNVSGESSLAFDSFNFVEVGGRPGHQGYFDLEGFPVVGTDSVAAAELSGEFATAQFDFRAKSGDLLQTFNLAPEADGAAGEFYGPVTLPGSPFVVYVSGLDSHGNAYQRVLAKTLQPQTVRVIAPASQDLAAGSTVSYVFQVKNFGAPNTFQFSAADDLRLVTGVSPASLTLGTEESAEVTVRLQVPAGIAVPATDTLTASVVSTATPGSRNFAILESPVVSRRPPDCSHAVPSVTSLWPVNHQFVEVAIQGVTSPDGSPVTLGIDGISQSEPTEGTGDGNTCPDAQGVGASTAQLRAERSGGGGGRTYTVRFTARSSGGTCQGSVAVCVPHNQGGTCAAPAASFDSTVCP